MGQATSGTVGEYFEVFLPFSVVMVFYRLGCLFISTMTVGLLLSGYVGGGVFTRSRGLFQTGLLTG